MEPDYKYNFGQACFYSDATNSKSSGRFTAKYSDKFTSWNKTG